MRVHEGLEVVDLVIDSISRHPQNANQGDTEALEESIQTNGFYAPILVQASTGFIIAGNHRWEVAKKLGATSIPAIVVDVTDDEAIRIMVADNRITRLGMDDPAQLVELLETMNDTDLGLLGTGYTGEQLQALLNGLDDPLVYEEEPTGDGEKAELPYIVRPIQDDLGGCTFLTIEKREGDQLTPADLNKIRAALGQQKLKGAQIDALGIESW